MSATSMDRWPRLLLHDVAHMARLPCFQSHVGGQVFVMARWAFVGSRSLLGHCWPAQGGNPVRGSNRNVESGLKLPRRESNRQDAIAGASKRVETAAAGEVEEGEGEWGHKLHEGLQNYRTRAHGIA